jgi:hypothetical protein
MEKERIYRSRLDFYYNSLIVYLIFLIVYSLIRGEITGPSIKVIFNDPIIYVAVIFVVFFLIVLASNIISAREIIFRENKIIFKNRFGQREVDLSEIIIIRFSRERKRRRISKSSQVRVAKLKLKNRKRFVRIRLSEYNNVKELETEFRHLSELINKTRNI